MVDEYDPTPRISRQLDRIEQLALDAKQESRDAKKESAKTDGRLLALEQEVYGPTDRQGRHMGGGLIDEFRKVEQTVGTLTSQSAAFAGGTSASDKLRNTVIAASAVFVSLITLGAIVLGMILR